MGRTCHWLAPCTAPASGSLKADDVSVGLPTVVEASGGDRFVGALGASVVVKVRPAVHPLSRPSSSMARARNQYWVPSCSSWTG